MLFCLVHGAWHDEACWQPLVAELEHRGHECVVSVLPLDDDGACFDDYAEVVVDCLRDRATPVLVGHSMSSAVIPLVAPKRPVRLLVYLCPAMGGFPPSPGEPPWRRAGYESPPWTRAAAAGGRASAQSPSSTDALGRSLQTGSQGGCAPNRELCSTSPTRSPARPISRRRSSTRARTNCSTTAGHAGSRTHSSASSQSSCRAATSPMLERPAALADVLETASGDQRSRTNPAARGETVSTTGAGSE